MLGEEICSGLEELGVPSRGFQEDPYQPAWPFVSPEGKILPFLFFTRKLALLVGLAPRSIFFFNPKREREN